MRFGAAFTLAVASHLLLDAIPHSDYGSLSRPAMGILVALESVVVGASAAFILRHRLLPHWPEYLLPGLFGSALPDAKFIAPVLLSDRNARLVESYGNRFHEGIHAAPTSLAVGVTNEVVCAILLLVCLYAFPVAAKREGDER